MLKISSLWLMVGVWLSGMFVASALHAQERDFATWANVGLKYEVIPDFTLSGTLEWRTKNNLERTDRWGLGIGGKYALLPFFEVGAGYEMHYRNRGENHWKFRHRYFLDGTLSTRLLGFKLSLRERLQHTLSQGHGEFRLRSRLHLAYEIAAWKLEPYVSVEMYNSLNASRNFEITRMRYRGGWLIPLSPQWEADIFYCRQWEATKRKDIIGLACTYSF